MLLEILPFTETLSKRAIKIDSQISSTMIILVPQSGL